jgi:hypothetical protein
MHVPVARPTDGDGLLAEFKHFPYLNFADISCFTNLSDKVGAFFLEQAEEDWVRRAAATSEASSIRAQRRHERLRAAGSEHSGAGHHGRISGGGSMTAGSGIRAISGGGA